MIAITELSVTPYNGPTIMVIDLDLSAGTSHFKYIYRDLLSLIHIPDVESIITSNLLNLLNGS